MATDLESVQRRYRRRIDESNSRREATTVKTLTAPCENCNAQVHYDPPTYVGGTGAGWQHVDDPRDCPAASPKPRCPECREYTLQIDTTGAWGDVHTCPCGYRRFFSIGD